MMKSVAFGFAAVALAALTSAASAQVIGIGTMRSGSTAQVATGVAKLISEKTKYSMRTIPQAGTSGFIAEVNGGQLEFGLGGGVELTFALRGTEMFEGKPHPKLRLVANLTTFTVGLVVRDNSPIQSVKDLAGKRVPTDVASAPSVELTMKAVLASGGLTRKDVTPGLTTSLVTMWEGFEQNTFDTAMAGIGSGRTKEMAKNVGGLRFLDVDPSPASIERMQAVFPGAKSVLIQPAPGLDGFAKATHVLGYDYFLFAGEHTRPEIVKTVLKALTEGEAVLKASAPVFEDYSVQKLYSPARNLEYHPAALEFYREAGLLK